MRPISIKVDETVIEELDAEADERDLTRSQYLRNIIEERHETERITEKYEAEIDQLESRIDELQAQLRTVNRENEDVKELVAYVEEERQLQRDRKERRDAPVWKRAKWWVFGRGNNDSTEE